jgi:hypothetical protein
LTYLGFVTEGKLAAIFIKPSLGVSNWPVIYFSNYTPTSFLALFNTMTPRDGAADWEGGSRVDDRAGDAGRCHPAADDTELAMDPNWSPANWVTSSFLSMATAACLAKASAVALA